MVTFIAFLSICDVGVVIFKRQVDGLPPMETSLRKHFLKSAVWFFQSAIFLGFVYRFYTFVHPVAAVLMFATAVCASYFTFVLLFTVSRGHPHAPETPSAGPCKFMESALNDKAAEFVKLDVDELPEVDRVVGAQK